MNISLTIFVVLKTKWKVDSKSFKSKKISKSDHANFSTCEKVTFCAKMTV